MGKRNEADIWIHQKVRQQEVENVVGESRAPQ